MSERDTVDLVGGAAITFKLVVRAKSLRGGEVAEAAGETRVLVHVNAQVTELLVLAGHCLAVQTPSLAR